MKNNLLYLLIIFILNSQFGSHAISYEQFNFDITEIEILDKGNKFIGLKRGVISTNDGTIINADTFEYDKISNILNAKGNVKIEDIGIITLLLLSFILLCFFAVFIDYMSELL